MEKVIIKTETKEVEIKATRNSSEMIKSGGVSQYTVCWDDSNSGWSADLTEGRRLEREIENEKYYRATHPVTIGELNDIIDEYIRNVLDFEH